MRLQPLNRFGRWGVFQQPARELAVLHRRKVGGIESRLVKHGRLPKVVK